MADENIIALLNQLFVHHYRSLPIFLTEASPWTHRGDENATLVVMDIVADQKLMCAQLASEIQKRGGVVDSGEYPMDFLELHFLSLDFLLLQILEHQREDVKWIERYAERLYGDPAAYAIAKEALGAARGHLESLDELTAKIPQSG